MAAENESGGLDESFGQFDDSGSQIAAESDTSELDDKFEAFYLRTWLNEKADTTSVRRRVELMINEVPGPELRELLRRHLDSKLNIGIVRWQHQRPDLLIALVRSLHLTQTLAKASVLDLEMAARSAVELAQILCKRAARVIEEGYEKRSYVRLLGRLYMESGSRPVELEATVLLALLRPVGSDAFQAALDQCVCREAVLRAANRRVRRAGNREGDLLVDIGSDLRTSYRWFRPNERSMSSGIEPRLLSDALAEMVNLGVGEPELERLTPLARGVSAWYGHILAMRLSGPRPNLGGEVEMVSIFAPAGETGDLIEVSRGVEEAAHRFDSTGSNPELAVASTTSSDIQDATETLGADSSSEIESDAHQWLQLLLFCESSFGHGRGREWLDRHYVPQTELEGKRVSGEGNALFWSLAQATQPYRVLGDPGTPIGAARRTWMQARVRALRSALTEARYTNAEDRLAGVEGGEK